MFCLMHVLTCLILHSSTVFLNSFCYHLKWCDVRSEAAFPGKDHIRRTLTLLQIPLSIFFTTLIQFREITSTRMLRNVVESGTVFFCQSQCSRWAYWRWDGTHLSSSRMPSPKELKCARMLHTVHFALRVLFTFMSPSVYVMHLFLFETK